MYVCEQASIEYRQCTDPWEAERASLRTAGQMFVFYVLIEECHNHDLVILSRFDSYLK